MIKKYLTKFFSLFWIVLSLLSLPVLLQAESVRFKWLEPYSINESEIKQLLKSKKKWFNKDRHINMGALGIKLDSTGFEQVIFKILVDRKLNLWRGKANFLGTEQGGRLTMDIKSIKNKRDDEIYNPSMEQSWENRVTIYQKSNGIFEGSRRAFIKEKLDIEEIGTIKGVLTLIVPTEMKMYSLDVNSPASIKSAQEHLQIEKISYEEKLISSKRDLTLTIQHPKPTPDITIVVLGYDKNGKLLQVPAIGASIPQDIRWYKFFNTAQIDKIHLWISNKKIQHVIPFTIK